jgi:hypothetical protein
MGESPKNANNGSTQTPTVLIANIPAAPGQPGKNISKESVNG